MSAATDPVVTHLVLGPAHHGVTRHGAQLAGPTRVELTDVGVGAADLAAVLAACPGPVHVHLTEHLLGATNDAVEQGMAVLENVARPVHVTLHDIPQPGEGEARFTRRAALYGRIARAAASVQVCSENERTALAAMSGRRGIGVVHLPVDVRDGAARARVEEGGAIGVLGFVHPGKNPGLALEVAAAVGRSVLLIGAVGAGHETFAEQLRADARRLGIDLEVTGHVSEAEMDEQIARVAVPLAPYRHVSASGSIGRWIAAGRRPVVLATPWARELAEQAPWALDVIEADEIVPAVASALAQPDRTLTGGRRDGLLSTAEAAQRQGELLRAAVHG